MEDESFKAAEQTIQQLEDVLSSFEDASVSKPPPASLHNDLQTKADAMLEKTTSVVTHHLPITSFSSPTKSCIRRIQSDLRSMCKEPIEGVLAIPDQDCVNVVHALITGPVDTPYENGLFLFEMKFPDAYPHVPPCVTLKTTGGGTVRFNPNLYADGKVCLSILGTWSGPSWSPVHTISSVLLSIQSLMTAHPYRNEPGFEEEPIQSPHVKQYNQYLRYQTLRVAVLDMVDEAHKGLMNKSLTKKVPPFANLIREMFLDMVETYKFLCDEYSFLDGRNCSAVPLYFCGSAGKQFIFGFGQLRRRVDQTEKMLLGATNP